MKIRTLVNFFFVTASIGQGVGMSAQQPDNLLSETSNVKLSILLKKPEAIPGELQKLFIVKFTVTNTGDKETGVMYTGSNRGLKLYLVKNDGTKIEIFPFDTRKGGVPNPVVNSVTGVRLAPGKSDSQSIRVPITVVADSSEKIVASINEVALDKEPRQKEIFSEPFSFSKLLE